LINGQPTAHYDLHPIVRRYAYSRLTNPTATHTQLVSYFEPVPPPERVRTLDDLRPTIELYHHLVHAGRYDEARLIAERAGYVLDLADIHNLLAQLALAEGDRAAAREHAQHAKKYAFCDGPPYSYKVAFDEAERLLGEAAG
jgi:hypothetical protein